MASNNKEFIIVLLYGIPAALDGDNKRYRMVLLRNSV